MAKSLRRRRAPAIRSGGGELLFDGTRILGPARRELRPRVSWVSELVGPVRAPGFGFRHSGDGLPSPST
eukprot:12919923-Alexandrium_andersonii.AAC.1